MRYTTVMAFLVLLLFFIPTFGAVANDVVRIVLISPSDRIDSGKTAKVEVHVFDNGQYVDPSQVQAHDYSYKTIPLNNKGTGIWNGTTTANLGYVYANAQIAGKSASATLQMRVTQKTTASTATLYIKPTKDTSATVPAPGVTMQYYISSYENGVLSDDYSLNVNYMEVGVGQNHMMSYTKVATGVYKTSFQIPQITKSTTYRVTAMGYSMGMVTATVDVPVDFCQVWFHKQTITDNSAAFDIYVSEPTGKALSGATVYLNYSYTSTKLGYTQYKNGGQATTDSTGKANYTIEYADVKDKVSLSGTVVTGGNVETYSGDIIVTPPQTTPTTNQPRQPMPFSFDVVYQGDISAPLTPGKAATLTFRAYLGTTWPYKPSAPLANKVVNYYVHTYSSMVAHGNMTTDSTGNMTLNIDVPSIQDDVDDLVVDFDSDVQSYISSTHTETLTISKYPLEDYLNHPEKLRDSNVQVSVDKLRVGAKSTVTAKFNGATSDTQGVIAWVPANVGIADMMSLSATQQDWEQLNGGNTHYMAKSDKTFTSNIYVPEFMPQGTYTIFVGCIVPEDMTNYNMYKAYHVNYLHVKPGEGGTTGGTGILGMGTVAGIDVFLLLLLFIIIIVVIVIIAVVAVRRSRRPVIYQQVQVVQPQPAPQTGQVLVAQPIAAPPPAQQQYQQYSAPPPPPNPPNSGPPPI